MTAMKDAPSSAVIAASLALATIAAYKYHEKKLKDVTQKLTNLRDAERKGRIKAEINLRQVIKYEDDKRVSASNAFYAQDDMSDKKTGKVEEKPMFLRCVGTIVSPFTKRMGTPRQGALAPHARGYIQMNPNVAPMETISGIDSFSHAWVIFCFHANTDCQSTSMKTKVKPPRAPHKVGSMATRSPHRPNNIGLSLVKITGVDEKKKRLYIAALDLVNGTPVYDVKPVVPWDCPNNLVVPSWVSQDDALSTVSFTKEAGDNLEYLLKRKKLAPLYTVKDFDDAKEAIKEILSQDPRAAKKRGKLSTMTEPYKVTFGSIELKFIVEEQGKVDVIGMAELEIDDSTVFVDGIPLAREGTMA